MILLWMVFTVGLSALLAGAAWCSERTLNALGCSRRWPWFVALGMTLVVPILLVASALTGGAPPPTEPAAPLATETISGGDVLAPADGAVESVALAADSVRRFDVPLAAGWALLSVLVATRFGTAAWRRRRRIQQGRQAEYGGQEVWFAPNVGPAVLGVFRPRIVLPAWFGRLDREDRSLVLRHEREHLRSGDPYVLLFAQLILAALPWNPVVWWAAARLKAALELDCDRRVLKGGVRPARYGKLLLVAKEHLGAAPRLAAFGPSESLLEERVERLEAPETGGNLEIVGAGLALLFLAGGVGWTHVVGQGAALSGPVSRLMDSQEDRGLLCRGVTGEELPQGARAQVRLMDGSDSSSVFLRVRRDTAVGTGHWPARVRLGTGDGLWCQVSSDRVRVDLTGPWGRDTVDVAVAPGASIAFTNGDGAVPTAAIRDFDPGDRWYCRIEGESGVGCHSE